MDKIERDHLVANVEASAAFLDACARQPKANWRLPVIERVYTVADVLRKAATCIAASVDHLNVRRPKPSRGWRRHVRRLKAAA